MAAISRNRYDVITVPEWFDLIIIIIIIITKHGDLRLAPTSPVQTKIQLKLKKNEIS